VRLLLDTCTFLWIVNGSERLSPAARRAFQAADNEVFLSVVSAWEIAVKSALGRLPLPAIAARFVPEQRQAHDIAVLPLGEDTALRVAALPELHGDPFDRMLICQAIEHGLTIATPDDDIGRYPVRVIW
jgi:PIN domain nuclease of toxin-antitoxin system